MKIVYLIGNGFDIKQGLKTRYVEFYEWYMDQKPSDHVAVNDFRKAIDPNHELWADMEWALVQYLRNVKSAEDAVRIFEDVQLNLQKYIDIQDNLIDLKDNSGVRDFVRSFFFPNEFYPPKSKREIHSKINFDQADIYTRIILFNYTSSLERLLGWIGNRQTYVLSGPHYRQNIEEIEHVNGYCDNRGRLALGGDSESQIANAELAKSLAVTDRYVKSNFNDTFELDHAEKCAKWIREANIIVLYGLSIGKTDQRWWDEVADNIKMDPRTLLFVHFKRDCTLSGNGGPLYQEQKRKDRAWLLTRLGLEEDIVGERIFITYDENWMKRVE